MGNDRVKEAADIVEAMSGLLARHNELQQQFAAIQEKKDDWQKYCSFCGKSKSEVGKLVTGPRVSICNECVVLCQDVLADGAECCSEKHPHGAAVEAPPAPAAGLPPLVESPFRAVHVSFDTKHLFVHLAEGTVLRLPLAYSPRLLAATQEQRESWQLIGDGIIHWDLVDDLSVVGMLCYARGYLKGAMDVIGYEESDALEDRYLSGCADAARLDPRPAVPYEEIAPTKHPREAAVEARPTWDSDGGRPVGLGTEASDLVGFPADPGASADRVATNVEKDGKSCGLCGKSEPEVLLTSGPYSTITCNECRKWLHDAIYDDKNCGLRSATASNQRVGYTHPAGTPVTVLERLVVNRGAPGVLLEKSILLVEVALPNPDLVGGKEYEILELPPSSLIKLAHKPVQDLKEVFGASADRVAAEAAALAQITRLQARVNYLDERMNWIANASGYEDLEDYHAFVEKTAHEALAAGNFEREVSVPVVVRPILRAMDGGPVQRIDELVLYRMALDHIRLLPQNSDLSLDQLRAYCCDVLATTPQSDSPFRIYVDKDAVGEIAIIYRPATVYATGKTIEESFALLAQEVRFMAESTLATPDEQCASDLLALKRWFELVPLGTLSKKAEELAPAWLHYQGTMREMLITRAKRNGHLPDDEESEFAAELDYYWEDMTEHEQELAEQMFGNDNRVESFEKAEKRLVPVWHKHYFSPLCHDEVNGRFDAVEGATGEIFMLDVGTGSKISCKSREEAIVMAKAAAQKYVGKGRE